MLWNEQAFDLVNGPIFKIAAAKDDEDTLVYLNVHHIAFDGWSTDILMRQLEETYLALKNNQFLPIFATDYEYIDYAYSQNRWLTENRLVDQYAFWQYFLQDAQTTLDLPTDFPYPAEQTFAGNTLNFTVPAASVEKLKSLAMESCEIGRAHV